MRIGTIAISILASLPLFAQNQVNAEKGLNFYSLEKEAALGKQLAAEVRQRTTPIENSTVQDYVDRLGYKLAAHMPEAKVHFTFSVIAEDPCSIVHEPSALPGSSVFVPAAMFLAARDEAEFAGMMAHAMAHIAARQATQLSRWSGTCTDGAAVPAGFLAIQLGLEREADALALQTMAQAGFDPNAFVRYTERVQPAPSAPRSAAFSTVPSRDQRLAAMTSTIAGLPATNYPALADGEFAAAREEVRRLVPTNNPAPPSLRRKMP